MKNIKWKVLLISTVICLLPILPCLIIWDKIPSSVAIHFDINNVADNFAPKWVAVLALPGLMAVLQIFCCITNDINAKKHGVSHNFEKVSKWIIPVMSVVIQGATIAYSLGYTLDIRRIAVCLVGIIFVVTGSFLSKLDYVKNKNISKDKAKKINRFVGILTLAMGLISIITVFLPPYASVIWLVLLIPYALACAVYGIIQVKKNK